MTMRAEIVPGKGMSVTTEEGKSLFFPITHREFINAMISVAENETYEEISNMLNQPHMWEGDMEIAIDEESGETAIIYKNTVIIGYLAEEIADAIDDQNKCQSLLNFAEKAAKCHSPEKMNDLFSFCTYNKFEIYEDGDIIVTTYDDFDGDMFREIGKTEKYDIDKMKPHTEDWYDYGLSFGNEGDVVEEFNDYKDRLIIKIDPSKIIQIPEPSDDEFENTFARASEGTLIARVPVKTSLEDEIIKAVKTLEEKKKEKKEKTFRSSTGKTYSQDEIEFCVEEHGQRGASRILGVARTTIQGWMESIKESKESNKPNVRL